MPSFAVHAFSLAGDRCSQQQVYAFLLLRNYNINLVVLVRGES